MLFIPRPERLVVSLESLSVEAGRIYIIGSFFQRTHFGILVGLCVSPLRFICSPRLLLFVPEFSFVPYFLSHISNALYREMKHAE